MKILRSEARCSKPDRFHNFLVGVFNFVPPVVVEAESFVREGQIRLGLGRLFEHWLRLNQAVVVRIKISPQCKCFTRRNAANGVILVRGFLPCLYNADLETALPRVGLDLLPELF